MAYLTDLSKQVSGNSTRRSISRRGGESIIGDLVADDSFQEIIVDDVKYTGTVVFKCDGKRDKDYKLELVKEKDSIGGGVNIDECELPDLNIGHEIDIDATLTGSYHVEGSWSAAGVFNLTLISTAQRSKLRATPRLPTLQP